MNCLPLPRPPRAHRLLALPSLRDSFTAQASVEGLRGEALRRSAELAAARQALADMRAYCFGGVALAVKLQCQGQGAAAGTISIAVRTLPSPPGPVPVSFAPRPTCSRRCRILV